MKFLPYFNFFLILGISPILVAHPSEEDRPVKIFFHCGKEAHTRMNSEGRGGLGALLQWVETEKLDYEKKNGRAYLLFPYSDKKDKRLNSYPYDGYQEEKQSLLEFGPVKLGIGYLSSHGKTEDLSDFDGWIYFVKESEEVLLATLEFPKDPYFPIFLLGEPGQRANFRYSGDIHQVTCPKDFGKLGSLELYFRKRDMIRIHHEVISINLTDRNRSWRKKHDSVKEEDLPVSSRNKTDKSSPEHKKDNLYGGLRNSYDREILGTETGFSNTPSAQSP